jgi:amidohydrolase family protein
VNSVKRSLLRATLAGFVLLALEDAAPGAQWQGPLFDAHLHYNGDMRSELPVAEALARLDAAGVRGIIATSTPNDGSLELAKAAEGRPLAVVPFLRPYRTDADRASWFNDPAIAALVDRELARERRYRGIGEFHIHGAPDALGAVMKHVVEVAVTRDLWLHAHCDEAALEAIFAHDARVKVIWAHTGFTTPPMKIAEHLAQHPTLMAELSYRNDVASGTKVTAAWRELFLRYSDRFILGSDTWTAERWTSYDAIIAAYRVWLEDLPPAVAAKLRWENAARMFGLSRVK